jgi:hypothetical protein
MTKDEALKKAFKQAFQLGQDYWYQADHEYESQNKKSDVTRAKFEQLMEDAIKEALAQPWEKFCDSNCVWTDHHPDCKLAQRTWVGLTDKDWNRSKHNYDFQKGADWAESILKEKNT